jgi:hypothetical protein
MTDTAKSKPLKHMDYVIAGGTPGYVMQAHVERQGSANVAVLLYNNNIRQVRYFNRDQVKLLDELTDLEKAIYGNPK